MCCPNGAVGGLTRGWQIDTSLQDIPTLLEKQWATRQDVSKLLKWIRRLCVGNWITFFGHKKSHEIVRTRAINPYFKLLILNTDPSLTKDGKTMGLNHSHSEEYL